MFADYFAAFLLGALFYWVVTSPHVKSLLGYYDYPWKVIDRWPSDVVMFHPMRKGLPRPIKYADQMVFKAPFDVILAPHIDGQHQWEQRVNLGFRVKIPEETIGIVIMHPNSFRTSEDAINEYVFSDAVFLPPGWTDEIFLHVKNKHVNEVGGVEAGKPIAELILLPRLAIHQQELIKDAQYYLVEREGYVEEY